MPPVAPGAVVAGTGVAVAEAGAVVGAAVVEAGAEVAVGGTGVAVAGIGVAVGTAGWGVAVGLAGCGVAVAVGLGASVVGAGAEVGVLSPQAASSSAASKLHIKITAIPDFLIYILFLSVSFRGAVTLTEEFIFILLFSCLLSFCIPGNPF